MDWIQTAFFVEKPNSSPLKVRLVTDYRTLNKAIQRLVHPFTPATELIKKIDPAARYFGKIDAFHGYF